MQDNESIVGAIYRSLQAVLIDGKFLLEGSNQADVKMYNSCFIISGVFRETIADISHLM